MERSQQRASGERPAPGSTIAVLLSNDRVFARVYVPEHLRARVTPGRSIDVRVDGVQGVLDGTVRWVSADATFTPYFALKALRGVSTVEALIPGTQFLPLLTAAWIGVRITGTGGPATKSLSLVNTMALTSIGTSVCQT